MFLLSRRRVVVKPASAPLWNGMVAAGLHNSISSSQNVSTGVSPAFASMPVVFFISGYSPEFVTAMMTVS